MRKIAGKLGPAAEIHGVQQLVPMVDVDLGGTVLCRDNRCIKCCCTAAQHADDLAGQCSKIDRRMGMIVEIGGKCGTDEFRNLPLAITFHTGGEDQGTSIETLQATVAFKIDLD